MNLTDGSFNVLADEVYLEAVKHGWWEDASRNVGEMIALMHSELSEALEELRKNHDLTHMYKRESDGKPEGFLVELADVIIRICDLVGWIRDTDGIDFDSIIAEKAAFNATRPYKHGKRF